MLGVSLCSKWVFVIHPLLKKLWVVSTSLYGCLSCTHVCRSNAEISLTNLLNKLACFDMTYWIIRTIRAICSRNREGASESVKQEREKQLKREKWGFKEGVSESAKQELKRSEAPKKVRARARSRSSRNSWRERSEAPKKARARAQSRSSRNSWRARLNRRRGR